MDNRSHQDVYDARYAGDYMEADAYTTWVHEGLAAQRVRDTLREVPISPVRLLDYGCGQGKWVGLLRSQFPAASVSGVDVSSVAVEKASQKYPECKFADFDGERAPFENATFDMVFSFHVLEHVLDITATIYDISRLIRPGGFACIIFPCGNRGSFEERLVRLAKDGRQTSTTGEEIFYFERGEGHLRRMASADAIQLFEAQGMRLRREFYSGQLFASLDWLIRGTGPHYINAMFRGVEPAGLVSRVKLRLLYVSLLRANRFLRFQNLDLTRLRSPIKKLAAMLVKGAAMRADATILASARREWNQRRADKGGAVQYLIFQKGEELRTTFAAPSVAELE